MKKLLLVLIAACALGCEGYIEGSFGPKDGGDAIDVPSLDAGLARVDQALPGTSVTPDQLFFGGAVHNPPCYRVATRYDRIGGGSTSPGSVTTYAQATPIACQQGAYYSCVEVPGNNNGRWCDAVQGTFVWIQCSDWVKTDATPFWAHDSTPPTGYYAWSSWSPWYNLGAVPGTSTVKIRTGAVNVGGAAPNVNLVCNYAPGGNISITHK